MTDDAPTRSGAALRPAPRWLLRPPAPPAAAARLSAELGVPPLLASVLWSRGLREDVLARLRPPLEPSPLPDLDAAAERLEAALRGGKRILIHGDYDADGITGTAVLVLGLRALGGNVEPFIPDRLTDGYGVHPDRVPEHAARADLFVTVDCGISNLAEIRRLQEAGVEVIVSDHHHPGRALPECLVVHPSLSAHAKAGLPELTGSGVAYHLLWALHRRLGLEPPLELVDVAAIGTIADVAPLMGENRALVLAGLERMADSARPGVRAMVRQEGLKAPITARQVAFVLAPRLNAAGRLGEADLGLELLLTASERRAMELAAYLDLRNRQRREIQDGMLAQALEIADPSAPALVVEHPDWHPGVMGIVASKLVERFWKPVFISARGKGSVRSVPGVSAVEALDAASAHLLRWGGHEQAAGFALERDALPGFRDAIHAFVGALPTPVPTVLADAILDPDEIDPGLFRAVEGLEPYGQGHPSPVFALHGALESARAVGRSGSTLQLRLGGVKGVAWGKGELAAALRPGGRVEAAASLRENTWNGVTSLEFLATEVRPAGRLGLADASGPAPAWPRLGPAPAGTPEARDCADLRADGPVVVRGPCLDAEGEGLDPLAALRARAARGAETWFDPDDGARAAWERAALALPSLHDVRRAWAALLKGLPLPFDEAKNRLARAAMEELELIGRDGSAVRGVKRDPFSSPTLRACATERYRLRTLLRAVERLDADGFARVADAMLAPDPDDPGAVRTQGAGDAAGAGSARRASGSVLDPPAGVPAGD